MATSTKGFAIACSSVQFVDDGQLKKLHLVKEVRREVYAIETGDCLNAGVIESGPLSHARHNPLRLTPHEQDDGIPVLRVYLKVRLAVLL